MIVLMPLPLLGLILAYLVLYWAMTPVRRRILGWRARRRAQLEYEREAYKEPLAVLEKRWAAERDGSWK